MNLQRVKTNYSFISNWSSTHQSGRRTESNLRTPIHPSINLLKIWIKPPEVAGKETKIKSVQVLDVPWIYPQNNSTPTHGEGKKKKNPLSTSWSKNKAYLVSELYTHLVIHKSNGFKVGTRHAMVTLLLRSVFYHSVVKILQNTKFSIG